MLDFSLIRDHPSTSQHPPQAGSNLWPTPKVFSKPAVFGADGGLPPPVSPHDEVSLLNYVADTDAALEG